MRLVGLSLLLLSGVLSVPSAVLAQAEAQSDVDSRYQALIEEAVMEFGEGRYAEARALFQQAHQLQPNARTLRGLGMTAFELRNYTEALRMLRASQLSRINPLTTQQQEHVAGLIERAEAFVGTYTVKAPEGTVFEVDGLRKQLDEGNTLMLDTGKRTLVAIFPGGEREERKLDIRGRERGVIEFHVAQEPEPVAAAPATGPGETTAPMPPPPAEEASLLPYFLIGGGGALVVGSLFTGYAALHNGQVVDDKCPQGVPCDGGLQEVKDQAETMALVTDLLLVSGLAAAGIGTWLLLSDDDEEPGRIDASIGASASGANVTLRGSF